MTGFFDIAKNREKRQEKAIKGSDFLTQKRNENNQVKFYLSQENNNLFKSTLNIYNRLHRIDDILSVSCNRLHKQKQISTN